MPKLLVPWDTVDALTFDVFDTAILRNVSEPRDVFILVEDALTKMHGTRFSGFATARFEAELETMLSAWRIDRGVDPGLLEIYRTLARVRPDWADDARRVMDLECEIELAISRESPAIHNLYIEALKRGKAIAFISDTYYPLEHMQTLLGRNGYDGKHQIFASNVEGINKVSGGLFDRAANALGISPEKILHIGDNARSDSIQARKRGFQAQLVPQGADLWHPPAAHLRKSSFAPASRDVGNVLHRGLMQNDALIRHLGDAKSPDRRAQLGSIGYSVLGPVLAGFSQWLAESVGPDTQRLHFVSRDGWLLKVAFEKCAQAHKLAVEPRYLLASRRALVMATFPDSPDDLSNLLGKLVFRNGRASLAQLCDFLGIAPPDKIELARMELASAEVLLDAHAISKKGAPLRIRIEAFFAGRRDEIQNRAVQERDTYLRYLSDAGFFNGDEITLVDCGWFGTTQGYIKTLMDRARPGTYVRGYFLGTAAGANAKQTSGSTMTGYLYHEGYGVTRSREFLEAARLMELLLKTDQPPFYCMESEVNGTLKPVRGRVCEVGSDMEYLQSEALRFVDDWLRMASPFGTALSASLLRSLITEILENPTMAQADALGSMAYSTDPLSDERHARFAMPSISTWTMLSRPDLRIKEVSTSGSRRIYEMLSPSPLCRFLVRMTQVDECSPTRIHAFARKIKRRLKNFIRI